MRLATPVLLMWTALAPQVRSENVLEGCRDPARTAQLLALVKTENWAAWNAEKAFSALPDAGTSRAGQNREVIELSHIGRLIDGDLQCAETLVFRETQKDVWQLLRVTVSVASGDERAIASARERFMTAVDVPSSAERSDSAGVTGYISPKPTTSRGDVQQASYQWREAGHEIVLRSMISRADVHRLWMSWERN